MIKLIIEIEKDINNIQLPTENNNDSVFNVFKDETDEEKPSINIDKPNTFFTEESVEEKLNRIKKEKEEYLMKFERLKRLRI